MQVIEIIKKPALAMKRKPVARINVEDGERAPQRIIP